MPKFSPFDLGGTLEQANRIAGGQTANQTALITLADLKAKQASEQEYLLAIKNNPEIAKLLLGGSTIAALPTTGGPPGAGPMTQPSLMPGQPPGAPQMVPGGQDPSRFANVPPTSGGPIPPNVLGQVMPTVTPPPGTPTLATLGPQGGMPGAPQGPQQAPQNPLLEMARRDPRAAMMLQQQMQAQQDRQWTMQEKQLDVGVKVAEYIARGAQAVKSQADLEALRQDLGRVHPQAAAQLPQMYSPEAMQPFITRGTAVADRAKNAKLEAEARRLDIETQYLPKMFEDESTPVAAQAPAGGETATPAPAGGAGNMGQRMNNPYNIKLGRGTQHWVDEGLAEVGESAQDGGKFIKFKDPQVGERAGLELLQGPGYRELTVDAAMKRWSNNGYGAEIVKDIAPDTKIKDLSAAQMRPLMAAMREREGWNAKPTGGGTTHAPTADPRVTQLETQIANAERQAKGWSALGNESLSTRWNDIATRRTAEKNRLLEESRHQQVERTRIAERTEERAEEIPRAVAKKTAETEEQQRLERQRQAGPMLPEDRRKLLTGLRSDIRAEPTFKVYQDVRNGYQNVRLGAESDSAQGDLAIINGIAKILDPSSSVMSGEAKNVEDAQGQLQVWFNSPQKFFEGDRLTTTNRRRFLEMAHGLAKEKLAAARTELTAVYEPLAKEGNIQFGQLLPLEDLKPIGPGPNVSKFEKLLEKK